MTGKEITERLMALRNEEEAHHLARFFKTGKGEYGEGDKFLGIRVPVTRGIVKGYRVKAGIEDVIFLTDSEFHEIRLAGFLVLIEIYKRSKEKKKIVDIYLKLIHRGNNWDLVDLVAPKILGDFLVDHEEEREILYSLARMNSNLWHQRVAIVSCWTLICNKNYEDAIKISEMYLTHSHDLIHKASGWMLRETGKRGGMKKLIDFLDAHAGVMPRTMLRYAIEKLEPEARLHYMSVGKS